MYWNKLMGVLGLSVMWFVAVSSGWAKQVDLNVSMAQPVVLADKKQSTFLKVGLTGFRLATTGKRTPVNVALVLDKSGSMSGDKIARAREAAISAVERLNGNDIVSVVTYDSTVSVVVPATKLTDRQTVIDQIKRIEAGGSTSLFAGVSKGAEELRKFLQRDRVNRVILLSDGLANVGPQSPSELGELGKSLSKEGISVSTIGLGLDYNEDLMTSLARESDGNHVFVQQSTELVDVFNQEFNDVLSVVAQEVVIKVRCPVDVRPVRSLNGDAEITGQNVYVKMNQLYSEQEKYVVLELELPARPNGSSMQVAEVSVSYTNMETKTEDRLSSTIDVNFSSNQEIATNSVNKPVMVQCVLQCANLENEMATLLRDRGDIEGAKRRLEENSLFLKKNADKFESEVLRQRSQDNYEQARWVENPADWTFGRKAMRALQYSEATQQNVPAPKPER
jgi:Ca-activated chloride channel family protein